MILRSMVTDDAERVDAGDLYWRKKRKHSFVSCMPSETEKVRLESQDDTDSS